MDTRISLITLGVSNLSVARTFYEKLGFSASGASQGDVVFFQAGALALGLYPRDKLAEDAEVSGEGGGFSGITLAQNVYAKADVARILQDAEKAGGRVVKPAQDVFWGGHHGYFADPDGHLWEIAWNPGFELTKEGYLKLPA
jgi:hypothetical protein